ncbi:unnamed protein product, partial [Heterotrigona itama]
EQYLFNVFEVIVSTLESKLQRIENLDKAVEHLTRRVEALDSRVHDNIDKTDAVIAKLRTLDLKLFSSRQVEFPSIESAAYSAIDGELGNGSRSTKGTRRTPEERSGASSSETTVGEKLASLDRKVSDMDDKLTDLKRQLESNSLQNEDTNAEASEKKPASASASAIEIANLVSDRSGAIRDPTTDAHDATSARGSGNGGSAAFNVTTMPRVSSGEPSAKQRRIDRLVEQIYPALSVSEKMDQVWNVVVGTIRSVDDLSSRSDELLARTQRQERAISEMHADLRRKTNKIIENLEGAENRLRKQEDDVAGPAELPLDPTIDRLVEYDSNRIEPTTSTKLGGALTWNRVPVEVFVDVDASKKRKRKLSFRRAGPAETTVSSVNPTTIVSSVSMSVSSSSSSDTASTSSWNGSSNSGNSSSWERSWSKNRGVVFPSVKKKPSPANSTFGTDPSASHKDAKIYSEGEYYKLEIDGYEGNAGDSLNDAWYGSNNSPFSTYNRDNDRSSLNCASMLKGGWWWKSCGRGLNGLYLKDAEDSTARQGRERGYVNGGDDFADCLERYRVVPVERLGLRSEAGEDDDQGKGSERDGGVGGRSGESEGRGVKFGGTRIVREWAVVGVAI